MADEAVSGKDPGKIKKKRNPPSGMAVRPGDSFYVMILEVQLAFFIQQFQKSDHLRIRQIDVVEFPSVHGYLHLGIDVHSLGICDTSEV